MTSCWRSSPGPISACSREVERETRRARRYVSLRSPDAAGATRSRSSSEKGGGRTRVPHPDVHLFGEPVVARVDVIVDREHWSRMLAISNR